MGIVGYGHIGSQLGVMAEALSMRVIFYDTLALMPIGRAQPVNSLNELLEQSDYVSISISSEAENKNLIGKEQIQKMKKGAYLLNHSYGHAVDLDALAEAIKSGHLRGAGIDVFPEEPVKSKEFKSVLQNAFNVILTPHYGK